MQDIYIVYSLTENIIIFYPRNFRKCVGKGIGQWTAPSSLHFIYLQYKTIYLKTYMPKKEQIIFIICSALFKVKE